VNELECLISENGGKYISQISNECYAIISNKAEIARMGPEMQEAQRHEINIVDEMVFSCTKFRDGRVLSAIRENIISDWGEEVSFFIIY
jgi:maleate cis-trans isomerase